jgi:prepilin peptidase CpaA
LLQISSLAFAALASGALVATVVDIRVRRIPNALTACMAGVGIGLAASGASGVSLGASLAGFVLGLALMMPGYSLGATGAGDVKFLGAVGAIVGPALVVSAFLFTAVAGGVLAIAVAIRRQRLGATIAGTGRLIVAPGDAKKEIQAATVSSRFAYGPAIAIGSVLAALIG